MKKKLNDPKKINGTQSIAYQHDPQYRPYPMPAPLSGPGSDLSPQQREIVRRLVHAWRLHPSLPPETLIQRLPMGVPLSREQDQLLESLRPGSRQGDDKVLEALWL